jgi:hypothetical protein
MIDQDTIIFLISVLILHIEILLGFPRNSAGMVAIFLYFPPKFIENFIFFQFSIFTFIFIYLFFATVLLLDHKFARNHTISHEFVKRIQENFFRVYKNCANSRLLFSKYPIIRTVQMMKIFRKKQSRYIKALNYLEFASRIREKSFDFVQIYMNSGDFARICDLVAAL